MVFYNGNPDFSRSNFNLSQKMSAPFFRNLLVTDAKAEAAFINEMNKKAQLIGMENTHFINSHGLEAAGQITTSKDMLLLSIHACQYPELLRIWGKKEYTFQIKKNERSITIYSTVAHKGLQSSYTLLGGKTGTLTTGGETYNLVSLLSDTRGNRMIGVTMGAKGKDARNKRFVAMQQLADAAVRNKETSFIQLTNHYVSYAGSLALLPESSSFGDNSFISINETESVRPASLTKIVTALILIDKAKNLDETFTIKESDLVGGSGPKVYVGDEITFYDSLHLMMLPSSNNVAKAIARVIGRRIIEERKLAN